MRPATVTLIGAGFERVYEVTKYKWRGSTGIELWIEDEWYIAIRSGMCAIIVEEDRVEQK